MHKLGFGEQSSNDWYEWARMYSPSSTLESCGLTIEEINGLRIDLAQQGQLVDPNRDWYMLMRHAAQDMREKLSDMALLAWDYYQAAEMLGAFLQDVTGEPQPHTDDVGQYGGGGWKQNIYGIPPIEINYRTQNVMPILLRQYGLDPRAKVLLIIEGATETAFIKAWCERNKVDFSAYGIHTVELGSVSELKNSRMRQYLRDAKGSKASVVVVVDDELNAAEQLKAWVADGLIDKIFTSAELEQPQCVLTGGILHKPCFEDANFTPEEILDAWIETINQLPGVTVDSEKLRAVVREQKNSRPDETWIKAIERVANSRKFGQWFNFNKPEIGAALARRLDDKQRPITRLLWNVVRIASLSRTFFLSSE